MDRSAVVDPGPPTEGHGLLVCVLANPPTTSGARTLERVQQVAGILGLTSVKVVNLFPLATYRTGNISDHGAEAATWFKARTPILEALPLATMVLLGYGTTEPTGPAREHHRSQVAWLRRQLGTCNVPTYQVGDGPRHPSRWQRWTFRVHPGVPFAQALRLSLSIVTVDPDLEVSP